MLRQNKLIKLTSCLL